MNRSGMLLSLILITCGSGLAKNKNPADYPLHVNVLSSMQETQFVYRGTDCTSTAHGEITGIDTLTARVYSTCDPNWAAEHYFFTEMDVSSADESTGTTMR